MYLPHSLVKRTLCLALALSLASPMLARSAGELPATATMANNILSGANGILGATNQFIGQVGTSNSDMQKLVQQMTQMQNSAGGAQTQQSQFEKIQKDLQTAVETAGKCVQEHSPASYAKYHKKHKDADKMPANVIKNTEVTCKNYGFLLDAIATHGAKMKDVEAKMNCITNLQNSVNQIAERAKQPFQQLTTAASEVYNTHTAIIDSHKQIAEKIGKELDGDNGYRARLGKLKQLSFELTNVLNGRPGENKDTGMKAGLVKAVEDLENRRVNTANRWYFSLMQDVEECFHKQPAPCFDNSVSLPPAQCLPAMIQNAGKKTAGGRARAATDLSGLQNIRLSTYMKSQQTNLPANLDLAQPKQFLDFTRKRFDATLSGVVSTYRKHEFSSSVGNDQITGFVSQAYNACYSSAVANFNADLASKGGRYYADYQATKDAERETGADITNWINKVEGEMSDFRTAFHKVYNSELAQFNTDCTAGNDPYQGLDCLRVFAATLDSGIRGTTKTTALSNGTSYTVDAGETQLTVQTLSMGADGKPTIGSAPVNCKGFEDCINYMERQKSQHEGSQAQQENDRKNFVDQHNSAVKASFSIVGQQFSTMSQLVLSAVNGINDDLSKLGVGAAIKTKDVEAEQLEPDEKTGMYKMPKSMKAALAAEGAYTEIEPPKEVTEAYNTLAGELSAKKGEATKMKNQCRIENAEYQALEGIMPKECSVSQVCQGNRITDSVARLEAIFGKAKDKVDPTAAKMSANAEFRSCVAELKTEASNPDPEAVTATAAEHGLKLYQTDKDGLKSENPEEMAKARALTKSKAAKAAKNSIRQNCNGMVLGALEAQAGEGRSDFYKQKNGAIMTSLRDVNSACTDDPPDEESVRDACEGFKRQVKGVSVPRDEDETGLNAPDQKRQTEDPFKSYSIPAK